VMTRPGRLSVGFELPASGRWELWLQGQFMPAVNVAVDGRALASIEGQLSGNSLVAGAVPPFAVELSAGRHRLTVTRAGTSLAPGNGGSAVLDSAFLTPAGDGMAAPLSATSVAGWRSLCGRRYQWIELLAA